MNTDANQQPPRLNYASLTSPISSAEVAAFKAGMPENTRKFLSVQSAVIGIGLVGVLVMSPLLVTFLISDIESAVNLLLLGTLLIVSASAVVVWWLGARYKKLAKLDRFAKDNGLKLAIFISNPAYAGMIFDEGHSRQIDEALQFPGGAEVGNFRYETGSGKNRQVHQYGYAKVKLSRRLPHMVLDSRKNNFLGMTNLPDIYKSSQSLKLEGDFNSYFDLYAPEEYARDALYVFTPDVMAAAIDSGQNYDMEIVDDELYIYQTTPHNLSQPGSIEKILTVVEKVSGEVKDQSVNYSDERVADKQQNIIADPGKRLKSGKNWIVLGIIIAVVVIQLSQYIWPRDVAPISAAVVGIFVLFSIVFGIYRKVRP